MTLGSTSTLTDVIAAVAGALTAHRIAAVLTGGSAATVYTGGAYLSPDIDFILLGRVRQPALDETMASIGFARKAVPGVSRRVTSRPPGGPSAQMRRPRL